MSKRWSVAEPARYWIGRGGRIIRVPDEPPGPRLPLFDEIDYHDLEMKTLEIMKRSKGEV